MKRVSIFLMSFVMVCVISSGVIAEEKGSMMEKKGPMAIAHINGTEEGSNIQGVVKFIETEEGLKVWAHVMNVPAGEHGFHIHENGSCDEGGKAAGGHYNPDGVDHGFLPDDGSQAAHAGDLGNIKVTEEGSGMHVVYASGLTVSGDKNVTGRAVIVHAKPDDFGQPTGNAGGRIACGLIEEISADAMKDMKGSEHDHDSMKGSMDE